MTYTKNFPIQFEPLADPEAMVIGPNVRFTVLTSRLLRLEYSPTGEFEDRPSQAFWYRKQTVPEFSAEENNDRITITTSHVQLNYMISDAGFTPENLSITLKETGAIWHFGDEDSLNLLGTARTLDNVDGALRLEDGLLSRSGYAVYDDTPRLVFNAEGWLEPRKASAGTLDLYFFGYGMDAAACLGGFARVAGPVPMVPRWSLGNWWSRYWAYSADELLGLMDEFQAHNVPLSVCIVDMDWHITDTGNASSGWTGFTWNRELFPDPPGFIAELHQRGLKTALNLHPADGIHPHEEKYPDIAVEMGFDPASKQPVPFDIADPKFTRAYFELLHHPMEADGVDFWWTDWQQGTLSGLPGLDPLWWMNHLYFHDLGRDGTKQSFIFSRWGGLGNHRYPIGFSGDAHVTWDSLAFQPYFTATAANVNYGWWSHDIGGHMYGVEEPELYTRWVQFGVFSPILRLHSTNNPFHERRPWGWDAETDRVATAALRLRHQLIPYIYAMAWRNHLHQAPLIRPMYHEFPSQEPAYHCPDQYLFGSELLAAPFITPMDPDVRLSRQVVWLPEGEWFDFFSSVSYVGDGWHAVYGTLDDIPVFAKAGAIVPMAAEDGLSNPEELVVHIFPGADNEFSLYEDDGLDAHSITRIQQSWSGDEWSVTIGAAEGETGHLPTKRTWVLNFRGAAAETAVSANADITTEYDIETKTLCVTAVPLPVADPLTIQLNNPSGILFAPDDHVLGICQKLVAVFRMESLTKQTLFNQLPALVENPADLAQYELKLTSSQLRALAEVLTDAGYHRSNTRRSLDESIVLWNNHERSDVLYKLAALGLNSSSESKRAPLPKFGIFTVGENAVRFHEGSQPAVGRVTVSAWFDSLEDQARRLPAPQEEVVVQFDISGENGRTAYLVRTGDDVNLVDGTTPSPNATITAAASDWLSLLNGEISPEFSFLEGKIKIMGNLELVMQLAGAISLSPPGTYQADKWRLDVDYLDVMRFSC
jgi:alpha-glucosidase (family GH31 glycosyl hydrolase)/putative sterol carrier protein